MNYSEAKVLVCVRCHIMYSKDSRTKCKSIESSVFTVQVKLKLKMIWLFQTPLPQGHSVQSTLESSESLSHFANVLWTSLRGQKTRRWLPRHVAGTREMNKQWRQQKHATKAQALGKPFNHAATFCWNKGWSENVRTSKYSVMVVKFVSNKKTHHSI